MTEYAKPLLSRTKRRLLILIALLAALSYVGAAVVTDASKTYEALQQLGWFGCMLVLALSALNYILRFYRWQNFVARLGPILPVGLHFLYYISGFAFTISPAKAGEAYRSIHIREHGVAYADSLAALFAERLLDLVAMCLLAGLITVEHAAYRPLICGLMALAAVLMVITCLPYLPRWLQYISDLGRYRKLMVPCATLANLLRSSRRLLQPKPAAFGLAIALAAWAAEGLGFYLICQGLHQNVNPGTAIGIYAIASLAGSAAFFLPAGIGGMEIVMTTLMLAQGSPLRTAVIATLLCRIATLWFAVLIGVAASAVVEFQMMPKPIRSTS